MTSSVFTRQYELFRHLLIQARKALPLTQADMAKLLGKPQSFVSKYENGERRIDIVEFLEIAVILKIDPATILKQLIGDDNDNF